MKQKRKPVRKSRSKADRIIERTCRKNETEHKHALIEMIADNEYREIHDELGLPNHE